MTRSLEIATLDGAAEFYAAEFLRPTRWSKNETPSAGWAGIGVFPRVALAGRDYVLQSLFNATFKDEHEHLISQMKGWMGSKTLASFEAAAKATFAPREDKVFAKMLKEHLAIDPGGKHIEGAIGKVEVDRSRVVAREMRLVRRPVVKPIDPGNPAGNWEIVRYNEHMRSVPIYWPIYAGEGIERAEGRIKAKVGDPGPGADPLPETAEPLAVGANVTNISAEACIAALDAVQVRLDEGDAAANIRGRTGSQPADPDAAETGTLLFTLVCTDPAVAGAVDDTDGTCSGTFSSITDDSSADATNTLTYCRFAAMGTGADDHIDGNATTDGSGATDWNTVSIVSGSTVSMTSAVLGQSQGSTAS